MCELQWEGGTLKLVQISAIFWTVNDRICIMLLAQLLVQFYCGMLGGGGSPHGMVGRLVVTAS